MRISSSRREVVARAGATVITLPPGEIYAALERGVIDTSEFIGPHDDMKLGLHKTARYYYYPGWHQPGTMNEFTKFQALVGPWDHVAEGAYHQFVAL